jgi:hypothetical protein
MRYAGAHLARDHRPGNRSASTNALPRHQPWITAAIHAPSRQPQSFNVVVVIRS